MSEPIEIQKLTKAIAHLTTVLVETVAASVRGNLPSGGNNSTSYVPPSVANLMTKKELAAYLNVSVRTIDNLVARRRLPYIRISSRCLRFPLPGVEEELKRRYRVDSI
jgi:excisionase family DNA binding protein